MKFLSVLKKSLNVFNNRLTSVMVTIVAKISNDETKDFSRIGIDGRDWGRSAISINSEGNKEIVSGILFFISKSSNVEFVLFEIFRKISRKKYLLIIQKTMAVKIIIKLNQELKLYQRRPQI